MNTILSKIREYLQRRTVRKQLRKAVSIISCVIVFVTTYALLLPALTLETKAVCGMEEHQHSEDCYEKVLICGLEESDGHAHSEECYNEAGELICGLEETPGHSHSESCYELRLVCGKETHIHTEECYKSSEEQEAAAPDSAVPEPEQETGTVQEEAPNTVETVEATAETTTETARPAAPEQKGAVAFSDYLSEQTSVYFYHREIRKEKWETADSYLRRRSGLEPETVYLDPEEKVLLHIAYELPAGTINATNAETEFELPLFLEMTSEEVKENNKYQYQVFAGTDREADDLEEAGTYEIKEERNREGEVTERKLVIRWNAKTCRRNGGEKLTDGTITVQPAKEEGFLELLISADELLTLEKDEDGENAFLLYWGKEKKKDDDLTTRILFDEEALKAYEAANAETEAPIAEETEAEAEIADPEAEAPAPEENTTDGETETTPAEIETPEADVEEAAEETVPEETVPEAAEAPEEISFAEGTLTYDGGSYTASVSFDQSAELPEGVVFEAPALKGADAARYSKKAADALGDKEIKGGAYYDLHFADADGNTVIPAEGSELIVRIQYKNAETIKSGTKIEGLRFDEKSSAPFDLSVSSVADNSIDVVTFTADKNAVYGILNTEETPLFNKGARYAYSIERDKEVSLSEIFDALRIEDEDTGTLLQSADVKDVASSDEALLSVTHKTKVLGLFGEEDWIIKGAKPFTSEEILTITLRDGRILTIAVTEIDFISYVTTADGENYRISVSYDAESGIPSDASLEVKEISEDSEEYAAYLAEVEAALKAGRKVRKAKLFDITILDHEGNKLEPLTPVRVNIEFIDGKVPEGSDVELYHFETEGEAPKAVENVQVRTDDENAVSGIEFETDGFSVYGVVYTVDFYWEVDGEVYSFSIPGGGAISLRRLVEILGISEDESFVEEVEDVQFSNPELVWAGRAEEEIEDIDAQTVQTGEWVLISKGPFDTEESLTVTMKNGEQFVIRVTDAQEITDTSVINPNVSYLICTQDENGYHVLKTDGTSETFSDTTGFDRLDGEYHWSIYYIFTEKDRETSLDYKYYFFRPVTDKTKSIALNEDHDSLGLVQTGANNIAVIPQEGGGFVFLGYNHSQDRHIELGYENGQFVAYNDLTDNPTIIRIYEQEPLPDYSFTVKTDNPEIGKVSGTNENGQTQTRVDSYITKTTITDGPDDKKNYYPITAEPVNHMNGGQNKWIFDYWDLDGQKLEGVGASIGANSQIIRYNGSVLTAHFKQNPNYIVPDSEKEGSSIEDLSGWLNELKNKNIPLNQSGCDKTAEVYDYENRIYRVDLTAQSSLMTFDGTIDLGFIIDASASMKFPSKLAAINGLSNVDIRTINEGNWWWRNWQQWGMDNSQTYYLISDENQTATVYRLFYREGYEDKNGTPQTGWFCIDASKDVDEKDNNGKYKNREFIGSSSEFKGNSSGNTSHDNNFHYQLYRDDDNGKTRLDYLNTSINGTLNELNEILGVLSLAKTEGSEDKNPDVKVAWNTFHNYLPHGNGEYQYNFATAKNGIHINFQDSQFKGGTSTDIALLDAAGVKRNDVGDDVSNADANVYGRWHKSTQEYDGNNHYYSDYSDPNKGFQWEQSATKYAVLITDGAPQRSGVTVDSRFVKDAAQQLKDQGVNLITVGLSVDNVTGGKILLYDIADTVNGEKMFYSAKSGDELESVLLQIIKQIMTEATVQGDVSDTINKAFYPVDRETGKPLESGQMIDLNGNLTTDASSPHGTITYDPETGLYGITWANQEFTWDGWKGTVYVKAREDFLGGNAVLTNSGDALIEAKTYTTPGNQQPTELVDEETYSHGESVNPNYHLQTTKESPRVNVNELNFLRNDTEWTVYLGTEVDPKEQIRHLYENILVEEVVNNGKDTDQDPFEIPDMIDYSDASSHHYPLAENDFSDDRTGSGEVVTFYLKDLILELIQDCINSGDSSRDDWNSFVKNDGTLNWDKFLDTAMTTTGLTIPYNKYGLDDVAHTVADANGNPTQHYDNSTVTITITKDVVSGEKDLTESPHATEVTGSPVETYTLTVLYSPDYDVVPKGQGGKSLENFHTGVYGTIYQGHAAGTETSENTHVINAYAEPLDVLKKNDHNDPVQGAVFKLYRKAKTGEDGVSLSSYDASLTDSYYCISQAASDENGIAHLAPDDITTPTHTIPVADGQTSQKLLVPLEPGETYYLVEESAPAGYKMDRTVRTVTVTAGPEFFTKLDKTTPVASGEIDAATHRPTIAYNWEEGVTITVSALGSSVNEATIVNHETREPVNLKDAKGNDRTYMLRSDSDQLAVTQIVIYNQLVTDISIRKVSGDGNTGLSGAVFRLVSVDGAEESPVTGVGGIGTVRKTVDGETLVFESAFETDGTEQTLTQLPDGTYRLYEAYIPAGYISTFRYIEFTLENHVITGITTDPGGIEGKVDYTAAAGNKLALLTIRNTPGNPLPNAGGPGTTLIYMIGILLTGFAGTGLMMKRKKKNAA